MDDELLVKVETLQNMLVSYATGGDGDDSEYVALREELLANSDISSTLPRFLKTCRSLSQFWAFIKMKSAHYAGRRSFLWSEFEPVIAFLEQSRKVPADESLTDILTILGTEEVHRVWRRARERLSSDPEGAITSARTLLETICKYILDEVGADYAEDDDLPKLYWLAAESLDIAPSKQTENILRQIFGGCQAVVSGVAGLRNRFGDAHGKGRESERPSDPLAELAVNLAGSLALFVATTWSQREQTAEGTS